MRAAAAWALGDIRVRRAAAQLIAALRDDPGARVRAMAANALGEMSAAAAEAPLNEAARHDPDQAVRRAAAPRVGRSPRARLLSFHGQENVAVKVD